MSSYRPGLGGADDQLRDYFLGHQLPEVLESLLTGILVEQPLDPWTFVQDKLQWILASGEFDGRLKWDMFVSDERRPPKRMVALHSYMDSLLGHDEEIGEDYDKACSLHAEHILRRVVRSWRRFAIDRQEKRIMTLQRFEDARRYHIQRIKRVHFTKWRVWLTKYLTGVHQLESSLTHVSNISSERFVFRAWHKYTQEAIRTTRWFKACEGDDDEKVADGGDPTTALRPPGCDNVSLLPRIVAMKVFSYLTIPELAYCSRTCRSWKVIVQQTGLWSRVDLSTCADKLTDKALQQIVHRCRPFLVHLNVRGCNELSPRGLSVIGECHNIQDVNLSECRSALTADSLQQILTGCRGLLYLNISYCDASDACLRVLSRHCPNLQHLSLAGCKAFTSRGLRHLSTGKGCHKVVYLDISDCTQLTTESLWAIGKACPMLQTLLMDGMTQLDDDSLRAFLAELRRLERVSMLGCSNVTDSSLKFMMKQTPKLVSFRMENNNSLTDSFVRSLARAPNLRYVCLDSCTRLTDNSLRALSQCKHLVALDLSNCLRISDVGVRYIVEGSAGEQLREINLTNCVRVSDVTLLRMAQRCHELVRISLCYCEYVQDAGVEMLGDLPNLLSLDLTGCSVADEGITSLGTNPRFAKLYLSECAQVTDNGLQKMCAYCPNLQVLDVSYCPIVTDMAMKNLAFFCHIIAEVNLAGCSQLTDLTVQYLSSGCHFLHTVNLTLCVKMTEKALRYLKRGCPSLRVLNLSGCRKITPAMVRRANLPRVCIIRDSALAVPSPGPLTPTPDGQQKTED